MAEKKKAAAPAAAVATDKKKALETALAQIEKNYGKGAIMRLGDDIAVNVEAIPTGSLSLDLALGIGGVPRGRIVEIYGPESCGKTTLALLPAALRRLRERERLKRRVEVQIRRVQDAHAHLRRTSCTSRQRPVSLSTSKIAPSSLAAPMAAS